MSIGTHCAEKFKSPESILKAALWIIAGLFLLMYLIVACCRMGYPFELEWMEGAFVDNVLWILNGNDMYTEPSLDYVPFIYHPLYVFLSALLSKWMGIGFFPLRFLSFVASLISILLIFQIVRKETDSVFYGWLACCLFCATFKYTAYWFDLGRVDSLLLLFLLLMIYVLRFFDSAWGVFWGGMFFALGYLTKQNVLILVIPILIYLAAHNRRWIGWFTFSITLFGGISTLILYSIYNDWYWFYIFDIPNQHGWILRIFGTFWLIDIFRVLPVAFIATVCFFYDLFQKKRWSPLMFYGLIGAGMIGISLLGRVHSGGYKNVLLPAYAVICICFGIALPLLKENLSRLPVFRKNHPVYLYVFCILQFLILSYDFTSQIPSAQDEREGWKIVNRISRIEGDVLIPRHGYLSYLAGKKPSAHAICISDIFRSKEENIARKLRNQIKDVIKQKKYAAIILDDLDILFARWFLEDITTHYRLRETLRFPDDSAFMPVTSAKYRVKYIFAAAMDEPAGS